MTSLLSSNYKRKITQRVNICKIIIDKALLTFVNSHEHRYSAIGYFCASSSRAAHAAAHPTRGRRLADAAGAAAPGPPFDLASFTCYFLTR